jgi:hypothetical protein
LSSGWIVGNPEVIPTPRNSDRSPEVGIAVGFSRPGLEIEQLATEFQLEQTEIAE